MSCERQSNVDKVEWIDSGRLDARYDGLGNSEGEGRSWK
jgi:hypothetical protein